MVSNLCKFYAFFSKKGIYTLFGQFVDGVGIDIEQFLYVFEGYIFVFLVDGGRFIGELRAETCPVFEGARISSAADGERCIRFSRVVVINYLQGGYKKSVFVVQ